MASINIPNGVTTIGNDAFRIHNLVKVIIEEGTLPLNLGRGCFYYAKEAFIGRTTIGSTDRSIFGENLSQISISNSCKVIGSYLFYDCTGLESINLPNSITEIGNYAFGNCKALTSLKIPANVITIGNTAFKDCSNLEEISFMGDIPQMSLNENSTFENDDKLISVRLVTSKGWKNLPKDLFSKVTFLDNYVEDDITYWKEWTKLEYLVSFSTAPPKIGDSFTEFQKWNIRVRVPSSALAAYQNTPVWKDFYFLNGGAETLGITDVETEDENSVKYPIYDLNGMRVDNPVPGHVYIRNGKKYVIGRH